MLIRSRSFALFCSVALSLGISSRAAAQAEGEATAAGAGKETPAEGKEAADEAAARAAEAAARKADAPKATKPAEGEADSALTPEQLAALKDAKTLANPRAPDRTSVGTRAISLPQGSGKVQGLGESFSMNLSTGVGTFSVPVPVPPARGGADPNFALSYSTSGGLGLLGQGWDIAVPYIARQTDRGAPKYDDRPSPHPEQDHFVYNGGQELIPLCVITSQACEGVTSGERFPAWAEGWQYFRPSIEGSFERFFLSPNKETWRIQMKSGLSYELGVPLEANANRSGLETDPDAPTHIFRWNLTRAYDMEGDVNPAAGGFPAPRNVVRYRYENRGGVAYLSDVFYTNPADGPDTADLATYAHHVRFNYETRTDPTTSYRRGYKATWDWRLKRVDVASKPTSATARTAERELVRRIHFGYDANYRQSELISVQMEGRTDPPAVEGFNYGLPAVTNGPRLPAMRLAYTHVAADGSAENGFERFSTTQKSLVDFPALDLDNRDVALLDVDQDGLVDLVHTDPSRYRAAGSPAFGWFKNGARQTPGRFSSATSLGLGLVGGDDASSIRLSASHVGALDLDGNGASDFVHLAPYATKSQIYRFDKSGPFGQDLWQLRGVETHFSDFQAARLSLFQDEARIKVLDANGDGLVDFIREAGSQLQVFYALGHYPGGFGLFGSGRMSGPDSAVLSAAPATFCVPTGMTGAGSAVRFDADDLQTGDMNGDGLVDLVQVSSGGVRFWPGRGDGSFGATRAATATGLCATDYTLFSAESPRLTVADPREVRLEDANGDGLDDLVHVTGSRVRIWLNRGDATFAPARDITGIPLMRAGNSGVVAVRFMDIDGSGTRDLVFGEPGRGYTAIDLDGGKRAGLLREVRTGLGKSTELFYTTSTAEALAAEAEGKPWTSRMPLVTHLVSRTVDHDNLEKIGRPAGTYETKYRYYDPHYEPRHRDFQGFERVVSRDVGDATIASAVSETSFLYPACVDDDPQPGVPSPCDDAGYYRDQPGRYLVGKPSRVDVRADDGTPYSTTFSRYLPQILYRGIDGRVVRWAYTDETSTVLYDPANPDRTPYSYFYYPITPGSAAAPAVLSDSKPGNFLASAGFVMTAKATTLSLFGEPIVSYDYGCILACAQAEDLIAAYSESSPIAADDGGWLFRPTRSYVLSGEHPSPRNDKRMTYDARGRVIQESAMLSGTLPLLRGHSGGGATAPAPTDASVDGEVVMSTTTYDDVGNATFMRGANGRCGSVSYDDVYGDFPVAETVYVGPAGPSGCGTTPLITSAYTLRPLGVTTDTFGIHGELSTAQYDGFGRLLSTYSPDPNLLGGISPNPRVLIEYDLPANDQVRPYTVVKTRTLAVADGVPFYQNSAALADGFGRPIATFVQADPDAGDQGDWVAQGLTEYDRKGNPTRVFDPFFFNGDPLSLDLTAVPPSPFQRTTYDPLSRPVLKFQRDNTVVAKIDYHALSNDAWDARDLEVGGPQEGTFVTAESDGHGRAIRSIERLKDGAALITREVQSHYLPTGERDSITRVTEAGSLTRWVRYDSIGRMVANVDRHATVGNAALFDDRTADLTDVPTWRYAYNDAGDVVGTSDARGCGVNFFYDAAGRTLAEDASPCDATQAAYSAPDLATGDGTEVFHKYDAVDAADAADLLAAAGDGFVSNTLFDLGREISVSDRGSKVMTSFDGRGRVVAVATKAARPGVPAATLADRYAARWYVKKATFDEDDRLAIESTGARSAALLAVDGTSEVRMTYTKRGVLHELQSSYGLLANGIIHHADGKVLSITYGDLAATQTQFAYDTRLRLASVLTHRGPPALWGTSVAGYSAPDPTGSAQEVLEHSQFQYDVGDNPTQIDDLRNPFAWADGQKPVTRTIGYDGYNRATAVNYTYATASGDDLHESPNLAEHTNGLGADKRGKPQPEVAFDTRVRSETYAYDGLGNRTNSGDDQNGFYDRSLGVEAHDAARPYQLTSALIGVGTHQGSLTASYDAAGNQTGLSVLRDAASCMPVGANCNQRYAYEWDEYNRLTRARRWDGANLGTANDPLPETAAAADLVYAYNGADSRTRTTVVHPGVADDVHTLYIYASLELRRTGFDGENNDYLLDATHERVYLGANGERLAQLRPDEAGLPAYTGEARVFFEFADHLGSANTVVDKRTGELVEKRTYTAYGSIESDHRQDRWGQFREDYGFTTKEEDVEVGLTYFGKRFYNPRLGRWLNADPLAVHSPGEADLNLYAYVSGRVFSSVDPLGLQQVPGTEPFRMPPPRIYPPLVVPQLPMIEAPPEVSIPPAPTRVPQLPLTFPAQRVPINVVRPPKGGASIVAFLAVFLYPNNSIVSDSEERRMIAASAQREDERIEKLGWDPAVGRFRENEKNTAVRIEKLIGGKLERFQPKPGEKGDWIDPATKTTYDGCTPNLDFFTKKKEIDAFRKSLVEHVKNPTVDKVVVDVTDQLAKNSEGSQARIDTLRNVIDELPSEERGKVIKIGF